MIVYGLHRRLRRPHHSQQALVLQRRSLPVELSTVTILLERFGSEKGPIRQSLDFRIGKRITFERYHLEGALDLINSLNANPAWTTNYASGPAFNYATSIQGPRTARLSAIFGF